MNTEHPEWIWYDGEWVRWQKATVHVTAHALHYGSSVFEGIRAYETAAGPAAFRLPEHMVRFFDSAKLLRMDLGDLTHERLTELCLEIVARNGHGACYIRPLAFRGPGGMGLNAMQNPSITAIISWEWGRYLGSEAIEKGIDAGVSSWRRFSPGSAMPRGKIGGQYVSNSLVSVEAAKNGFQEGIMLDHNGTVSEGAGENLFLVLGGELVTPPLGSSILAGITRNTVLQLAADQGLRVHQEVVTRDMLYLCDELFMTGTAAEITPVRSVDNIPVGDGHPGPVTQQLQQEFFGIVHGELPDRHGWLMPVPRTAAAQA